MTIPRCELQAAVIGSNLTNSVDQNHRLKIDKFYYWSDSRTVLYWIKSDHRRFKPYVANRVAKVLDFTESSDWFWVPTKINPADEGEGTRIKLFPEETNKWIN